MLICILSCIFNTLHDVFDFETEKIILKIFLLGILEILFELLHISFGSCNLLRFRVTNRYTNIHKHRDAPRLSFIIVDDIHNGIFFQIHHCMKRSWSFCITKTAYTASVLHITTLIEILQWKISLFFRKCQYKTILYFNYN